MSWTRGLFWIAIAGGALIALPDCSSEAPQPPSGEEPGTEQNGPLVQQALAQRVGTTRLVALSAKFPGMMNASWQNDAWRLPATATARVELSTEPSGHTTVRDNRSALAVTFQLQGAASGALRPVTLGGTSWREGAGPEGSDVVQQLRRDGVEDFVFFATEPADKVLRYDLDVSGVAGLRLVENTLEMLDTQGTPRLRVAPPFLQDATGARIDARLALAGCAYDDSAAPPWGRPVTAPGGQACRLTVSWAPTGVAYPALVDPVWQTTSNSMVSARLYHSATPLVADDQDSLVLLVGGFDAGGNGLTTAELYHPLSRTFSTTGTLNTGRGDHAAVGLGQSPTNTNDEYVLISGGRTQSGGSFIDTIEIYDPDTGTFGDHTAAGGARAGHTATLLVDGRVLIAGGTAGGGALNTFQTYDFTGFAGNNPTAVQNDLCCMTTQRVHHTASLLSTDKVLIAGGMNLSLNAASSGELFDPGTNGFSGVVAVGGASTQMLVGRMRHTATVVPLANPSEDLVVIVGGTNGQAETLFWNTIDVYRDGAALTTGFDIQGVPVQMNDTRADQSATLLPSTVVLPDRREIVLAGGRNSNSLSSAERATYDLATRTFSFQLLPPMTELRHGHAAMAVNAGSSITAGEAVLVTGGDDGTVGALDGAEVLFKINNEICTVDAECLSGICAEAPTAQDPTRRLCCNDYCTGVCESCSGDLNVPQTDGLCAPIVDNHPLPTKCLDGATDQTPGDDDVEVHTACDGLGAVKSVGTTVCTPNTCNGTNTACSAYCLSDTDCSDTGWCDLDGGSGGSGGAGGNGGAGGAGGAGGGGGGAGGGGPAGAGTCAPKGNPGEPCTMPDGRQCLSGHCVDSVCCDTACTGQCQACDTPNNTGSCTTVGSTAAPEDVHPNSEGLNPRPPCAGAASDCGGSCDGLNPNACTYPGEEQEEGEPTCTCVDASCIVGPAAETHQRCDGEGSYTAVEVSCVGYRCAGEVYCKTSCSSDEDCLRDFICEEEACVELTGPSCDGEHTVRVPEAPDIDCTPFACEGPACLTQCKSVDDCVAPMVCNAAGACVEQLDAPDVPGCSCRLVGHAQRSPTEPRWAWWAALAGLATVVRRRRRNG